MNEFTCPAVLTLLINNLKYPTTSWVDGFGLSWVKGEKIRDQGHIKWNP